MIKNFSKLASLAKRPNVFNTVPNRGFHFFFPNFGRFDRMYYDMERQMNRELRNFERMERQLDRQFRNFEFYEEPEVTSYRMRVNVDENGNVRVKTAQKKPGSDWRVSVEEYNRDKKSITSEKDQSKATEPEKLADKVKEEKLADKVKEEKQVENEPIKERKQVAKENEKKVSNEKQMTKGNEEDREVQTKTYRYSPFYEMQQFTDALMRDMDSSMKNFFEPFEFDEKNPPAIGKNGSYSMKMEINDNGHVTVKTVKKEPGRDWEVKVDEYGRKRSIENSNPQRIEGEKESAKESETRSTGKN